jgi:sulfatase maturation enzyme AslB (radical SAM superfamily)
VDGFALSLVQESCNIAEADPRLAITIRVNVDTRNACTLLPLCMGGCPHVSIGLGRGACTELKHNLKETILLHYLGQQRKQATRQLFEVLEQRAPKDLNTDRLA